MFQEMKRNEKGRLGFQGGGDDRDDNVLHDHAREGVRSESEGQHLLLHGP
jgi:hypothetical protein